MSSAGAVWGLWCRPHAWPTLEAPGDGASVARPDVVIDIPQRIAWSRDRGWTALGDVRRALGQPTGVCALIAHGDGSHLDLGDAILCGLTDDGETVGAARSTAAVPGRIARSRLGMPGTFCTPMTWTRSSW